MDEPLDPKTFEEPTGIVRLPEQSLGISPPSGSERAEGAEPAEARTGSEDVEALKQMLQQQKEEAFQLQEQLDKVRSQIKKGSKQYVGVPKGASRLANPAAEISIAQANLYNAKKELEREQRVRREEGMRAAAAISQLESNLTATVTQVTTIRESKSRTRALLLRTGATIAAAAALGAIGVVVLRTPHPDVGRPAASARKPDRRSDEAPRAEARAEARPRERDQSSATTPPQAPVAVALDQLGDVLAAGPGVQEKLKARKDCAIEWNENSPTLVFGGKKTLEKTMAGCTDTSQKAR